MTNKEHLERLCRSRPELELLLKRLEEIAPIVRQQQAEADRLATKAHFQAKGEPEHILLSVDDWLGVDFKPVNTAEARELHSIGLAVAAFGGSDAISLIGWVLSDRGCDEGRSSVWNEWDGMAGHWL